jgi:hypothetical protein
VKTNATDGTTTAKVKVMGRGWRVVLDGPVDEQGFHAAADVRAVGFALDDVPVTLDVGPGPEPPPPPPPPDPPNLIAKGTARIVAGQVQISRENAPSKFFGSGADVNVDFPVSDVGQTSFAATPATSGGATPRRFYVTLGAKTYGTAGPGGSVNLSIRRDPGGSLIFSTTPGKTIEVVCQGQVADAAGRTKPVDVIVRATVVQ